MQCVTQNENQFVIKCYIQEKQIVLNTHNKYGRRRI